MDIQQAFEILEISESCSFAQAKQAYRDLVAIWHPDRHTQNQRLYSKANEKTKEINQAYSIVVKFFETKQNVESTDDKKTQSNNEYTIFKCRKCNANNRIMRGLSVLNAKCGKCGSYIINKSDDWESRTLCSDGNCIGVIGANGHCKECGKPYGWKSTTETVQSETTTTVSKKALSTFKKHWKLIVNSTLIIIFVVIPIIINQYSDDQDINNSKTSNKFPNIENPPVVEQLKPEKKISFKTSINTYDKSSYEKYYNVEYFFINIDKITVTTIQQLLLKLGYKIGIADGIIGNKTLTGLRQFSEDFNFVPDDNFPEAFIKNAYFHAQIKTDNPDWQKIYTGTDFEQWANDLPDQIKEQILEYGTTNIKVVSYLLNLYKFDKIKPPPLPIPKNGIVRKNYDKGIAPLTVKTKYKDQHHFIKLVREADENEILSCFIRGGTSLSLEVPVGSYKLKSAVGSTWYGIRYLFGPNTVYSEADKIFNFNFVGDQVSGYTVELYLQPHGNFRTDTISLFQF